ncbi:MAG: type II secretion system protein N [Gammaproteobacteria bacterium]|nr:type II secretion system protein N [Gammaproteobacteria bacterium]
MKKKKIALYSALALVSYLVFVAVQTPADRLYGLIKDKLPDVKIYQLDGTIWQGRTALVTIGPRAERLESLKWELQPAALLLGRAQAEINFKYDNRNVTATVGRSVGGYFLKDLNASLVAATVEKFAPQLAIGLKGLFKIELDALSVSDGQLSHVEGKLTWRDAGVDLNNTSFGDFEAILNTVDGTINGVIRDIDGPMKVNGTLILQPTGEYVFAGTIELRDDNRNDLRQGLRFIGTPNPKGIYTIKYQGQLPMSRLAAISG